MSLTQIILPPPTPNGFEEWAFAHFQHHLAIIDAVRQTKQINLQLEQIWPVSIRNVETWLEAHQFMHNEMNAVLGVQGNDLSTFNWQDEKQREGFFYLNFQEHRSAAQNAGVPI
jgi:hypothetical protein